MPRVPLLLLSFCSAAALVPGLRPVTLRHRAAPRDDLSVWSREELEAEVRQLRAANAALSSALGRRVDRPDGRFSLAEASNPAQKVLSSARVEADLRHRSMCAGFAFESYNDPDGARWERGAARDSPQLFAQENHQ